MPLIGEWIALPLAARAALGLDAGDVPSEFLYRVARRVLARCDAVYRIPGASHGADGDVAQARALGLPCFHALEEVPEAV